MSMHCLPAFMDRGNSNRVRKAPGGDTNDIFDLEKRQRQEKIAVYEDKNSGKEKASGYEAVRRYHETEDINYVDHTNLKASSHRRSLSDGKLNQNEPRIKSPPLAVGKENLGTHFKGCMSPRFIMSDIIVKQVEDSEDECSEDIPSDKNANRNPVTAKEIEAAYKSKLGDTLNILRLGYSTNAAAPEEAEMIEKKKPRRPCIRVQQPPGGKSSIIF